MPNRAGSSSLLAGAAAFAAAELTAGLLVGRLFAWGRAEALLFFAFRPWLLLVAALLVARLDWRRRFAFYALALATAGLSESLLLVGLGGDPWLEMLRGWAAAIPLALAIDLLLQLGRWLGRRIGQSVAAGLVVLWLVVPGGTRPYEAVVLGPTGSTPSPARPALLLMTGLPLVWGETGPFDPDSRPAAAYQVLQVEFDVTPIDHLDPGTLAGGRLMLLAQPRLLEPAELAALDAWVRRGGHVLILADPDLVWPSRLPLGDIRRPPPQSLLSPLLDHWGLRLAAPEQRRLIVEYLRDDGAFRRLTLAAPGRLTASRSACRAGTRDYLAVCEIGGGRALVVADADLLRDETWTAPMPRGTERHARLADNPLVVAGWLDRLAGIERERGARAVIWQRPHANRLHAILFGTVPILLISGLFLLFRARRA